LSAKRIAETAIFLAFSAYSGNIVPDFSNEIEDVSGAMLALPASMAVARDFNELEAWQLADQVRQEICRITDSRGFQKHPRLREQLQDAADSACSNTAEGFSRFKPKDFARFVRISRGSLSEVMDRLLAARRRGLITDHDLQSISALARRARAACTGLILYLESAREPGQD
jgi:four helix bundle protein